MRLNPFLRHSSYIIATLLLVLCSDAVAQDPKQKGLAIATEQKNRDTGWGDSEADVSMILRNARGQESERKIRIKSLEMLDDGDKSLTIFDQPRDVSGTAFLSFSHATKPDDQWIYLPQLKRVKRIASKNKSGPFMGSEFAFEDMTSFELEKYEFTYLRDEVWEGMDCYVVQQVPLDEFSGYTRRVAWIDKEHYRAHKIEYYDRKDDLLKELVLEDYELYKGKFWRPLYSAMNNVQNGKSTMLITHSIVFDTGLEEQDFDKNTLKRAR